MTLMKPENARKKLAAIVGASDWPDSFIDIGGLDKFESWFVNRMYILEAHKIVGWKSVKYQKSRQGEWKKLKYIGRSLGLFPVKPEYFAAIKVINIMDNRYKPNEGDFWEAYQDDKKV